MINHKNLILISLVYCLLHVSLIMSMPDYFTANEMPNEEVVGYGNNGTDYDTFMKNVAAVNKLRKQIMVELKGLKFNKKVTNKNIKEQLTMLKIKHDFNILNSNLEFYLPSDEENLIGSNEAKQ